MKKYYILVTMIIIFLSFGLLLFGEQCLSFSEIFSNNFIVSEIRLPILVACILSGFAFGISGNTFQQVFKNPLASPDLLGIMSSASIGCLLVKNNSIILPMVLALITLAFIGYFLYRGYKLNKILVIGIAIQGILLSCINIIIMISSPYDLVNAYKIINGSLSDVNTEQLIQIFLLILVLSIVLVCLNKYLKILILNEDKVKTLGINYQKLNTLLLILASLLATLATILVGPLSTITLVSGIIANKLVPRTYPNQILSGLIGIIIIEISQLFNQTILGQSYPIGVLLSFIGCPILMVIILKRSL